MLTMTKLMNAGTFTVEEWHGVCYSHNSASGETTRSGGYKATEYEFFYDGEKLFISGDVFAEERYQVKNPVEVLFKLAKSYGIVTIKLEDFEFDIHNVECRLG